MIYILYACFSVFLVVLKTAVLGHFPLFRDFYDILLPVVLYLGLFRPVTEGLPLVLFCGFCMDSLTGGPFGIYISVYFWLFIAAKGLIQFFHAQSILIKPFIVFIGVVIENLMFFGLLTVFNGNGVPPESFVQSAVAQSLWAFFTGYFFLIAFDYFHESFGNWFEEWTFNRKENG
jgi:rod shape-determining protein MreD